ncbi:MAG: hypothetical protein PVH00_01970 [Gemmatimonadota bacterium]|jgi:hypothetical protein
MDHMTCQDCIGQTTDFLDETLSPIDRARHAAHIERCPSCARYHRVLKRGLGLARDVAEIEPSAGFRMRLHGRLRGLEEERRRRERAASGAALVLAVAGLVALAAWVPVWQDAMQARRSSAMTLEGDAVPGPPPPGSEMMDWWWYGGMGGAAAASRPAAAFPGPYSPLIVQPPVVPSGQRGSNPGALVPYGDSE